MPVPTAQERVKQHVRQTKHLSLNSLTEKKGLPTEQQKTMNCIQFMCSIVFNLCSVGKKGMQHIQLTVLHLLTLRNATRGRNIRSFG